jgi:hypothetical protein
MLRAWVLVVAMVVWPSSARAETDLGCVTPGGSVSGDYSYGSNVSHRYGTLASLEQDATGDQHLFSLLGLKMAELSGSWGLIPFLGGKIPSFLAERFHVPHKPDFLNNWPAGHSATTISLISHPAAKPVHWLVGQDHWGGIGKTHHQAPSFTNHKPVVPESPDCVIPFPEESCTSTPGSVPYHIPTSPCSEEFHGRHMTATPEPTSLTLLLGMGGTVTTACVWRTYRRRRGAVASV